MTTDEAKRLLLLHSFALDELGNSQMMGGFLGSLRPYRGLREENFHEIMAALRVLAPQFGQPQVDTQIIQSLWSICHLARAWGIHEDGMLCNNNLISPADVERLESWIETISYATLLSLEGAGEAEAFADYSAP